MLALSSPAVAEKGDAIITVDYETRAVRVRPEPDVRHSQHRMVIVLHPDGRVEDEYTGAGPHPSVFANKNRRLGNTESASNVRYRVVDKNTISRTSESGALVSTLTVVVSGKTCTANIDYSLKPGETEFKAFSTQLGTMAYYSETAATRTTCKIR
jgi:hypothetical protein